MSSSLSGSLSFSTASGSITAVTPTFTGPAVTTRLVRNSDSKPAGAATLATTILVCSPRLLRNSARASPTPTFMSSGLRATAL